MSYQVRVLVLLLPEGAELTHLQQVMEVHDALDVVVLHLKKLNHDKCSSNTNNNYNIRLNTTLMSQGYRSVLKSTMYVCMHFRKKIK